jgi:AcrR family transcriptional regulator
MSRQPPPGKQEPAPSRPRPQRAAVRASGADLVRAGTRDFWVDLAMSMLRQGRAPGTWRLSDLTDAAGLTKGSFYARGHFPGGINDLYDEVLRRWEANFDLPRLEEDLGAVRDPADRLRLLLERALAMPGGPAVMQRWAASSPTAAEVLAGVEGVFASHATQALSDLGLSEDDATRLGYLLARAYLAGPPTAADRDALDTLIAVLQPASAWKLVLYAAPAALTDADLADVRRGVERFLDEQRSAAGTQQDERAG